MSNARFRHVTFIRALDVLEQMSTNAQFVMMIEELGCGDMIDRLEKSDRTTPKLKAKLAGWIRRNQDATDTEGADLRDSIIQRAARAYIPHERKSLFGHSVIDLPEWYSAFVTSLAVDGWTARNGSLTPETPVPVQPVVSSIRLMMERPELTGADRGLMQIEAALDGGHWEAANAGMRTFLAEVFIGIAQIIEPPAQGRRDETEARIFLSSKGFFKPSRQPSGKSEEGEFIQKMFPMLGTEGSHSGASDQATALYRYALTVQTAHYFLSRQLAPASTRGGG